MAHTTVINQNNVPCAAADIQQGTDFFLPSAGANINTTEKSWKLQVTKPAGFSAGTKYLIIAVDYFYSSNSQWHQFWTNAPAGWTVDLNIDDDGSVTGTKGATYNFDWSTFTLGSLDNSGNLIGERPTKVRLHILFSVGFTSPNILYQTANDLSLLM